MNTSSEKNPFVLIIPETLANKRLDQALAYLLPDYSRSQIQEWIESGHILMNNQPAKVRTKVKGGETVAIKPVLKTQPEWTAQAIPLDIIHEDEALIIVNKPVGMVVHPGAGNPDHTLLNALLHHLPSLQTLPRAGILHRLDKDTSGLLVIAKTSSALNNLARQLKKRTLLREYQAIVRGTLISGGTIDAPIGRHPVQRQSMTISETGKHAVTHYRIAEKYRAYTRLKIRLETGRTHQIRVHLAHLGYPIIGDPVYGGRLYLAKNMSTELIQAIRVFKRQALHAFALGLTHPLTHTFLRWEIPLPDDMKALIAILREDTQKEP